METEHEETTHHESATEEAKKAGSMMYAVVGIVVIVLAAVGYKFLMKTSPTAPATTSSTNEQGAMKMNPTGSPAAQATTVFDATTAQADADGVVTIPVEAGSFYYKPNEIHAKQGQKIKIELKSVDMMHNFVIDDLGVSMPVTKGGSSAEATFTAMKVGTFEYYCSVGQHRKNGQVGKIVITE